MLISGQRSRRVFAFDSARNPHRMSFYSDRARQTQSSPSVSLEKGAYRLRAPAQRGVYQVSPLRPRRNSRAGKDLPAIRYKKQMAMLIVFLICATVTSFGTAYYLLSTRWDFNPAPQVHSSDAAHGLQVADFDIDFLSDSGFLGGYGSSSHPEEKFLAYLPHSGFHNQRIAFENALVLSHLLNRTLLVPPVHLGNVSLPYYPFPVLQQMLVMADKRGLQHCGYATALHSPECTEYSIYTYVPWDWLVDLTYIKRRQPLVPCWTLTDEGLQDSLGIAKDDIFVLADSSRDMYGFQDFVSLSPANTRKYQHMVHLSTLLFRSERLIQLGTLFGSSRLHLRNAYNLNLRKDVRESMARMNPLLHRVASAVKRSLGGQYLGAHLRLGDGIFQDEADKNSRLVWWKLVHGVLGYSIEETMAIEHRALGVQSSTAADNSEPPVGLPVAWELHQLRLRSPWPSKSSPHSPTSPPCDRIPDSFSGLPSPGLRLFISTDVPDPRNNTHLTLFMRTFPCVAFLSDFGEETASLDKLQSPLDGLLLKPFLLPFVDALVVSSSEKVVGTDGSTFSRFVEDVLWRVNHGYDIAQKG